MQTAWRGAARWRATVAVALALVAGCSTWREEPEPPSALPAARMSPDTIVLEIFTLEAPAGSEALCEEIWRQLDEQHLPPEVRMRLAANGMRCGRCGLQLPPAAFELVKAPPEASPESDVPAPEGPMPVVRRRLQSRSGRRGRIPLGEARERLEVLRNESGELRDEVYNQATCVVAVRTFPLGDGRARIELTPEIEHGLPRQRLIEGDGALRWEPSQERRIYDDLCLETLLAPGQTLVVSAAPTMAGLGRAFFVHDTGTSLRPVLLVLRLAQTQHDDRFAPEQAAMPLVTPSE